MDRKAFYASIRASLFGGSIPPNQFNGLERLLNVWDQFYAKDGRVDELAYDLATSFHETGATMQPITELGSRSYFDKYEPGTAIGARLGNTQPGDGYRFRGEGDVQNTGRRNAVYSSRKLNEAFGLNVDFVANPEKRGDPILSAHCLFLGNRQGWWTGRNILQYVDGVEESDAEDLREWTNARAVVNGTDRAAKIAGYALHFDKALEAAAMAATVQPAAPQPSVPAASGPIPVQQPATSSVVVVTQQGNEPPVVTKVDPAPSTTPTIPKSKAGWGLLGIIIAAIAAVLAKLHFGG